MTLTQRPAPHVRHTDSITVSMADVLLALLPCLAMGVYYYGVRLLLQSAVAVLTALVTELAFALILRRRPTVGDLTAVVTGLIISLLLPVGLAYRYFVLASAVAILVAKLMFGGVGKNIFNPALVGVTLVTLIDTAAATTCYAPHTKLPLWGAVPADTPVTTGVLSLLKQGEGAEMPSLLNVFIGKAGDVPASVCLPVILAVGLYLVYRRIVSLHITLPLLGTVAVLALLFPRAGELTAATVPEVIGGGLIFCAVFCANDPVTTPNTVGGQVLFGIFTGIITMLIRWYGRFDDGIIFAVLIMNALSFALDKATRKLRGRDKGGEKHAERPAA